MSLAIEDRVLDFLEEEIEALADDADPVVGVLFEAQLIDSPYATIEKEFGVAVDDADSEFAPTPGATDIEEFDGDVTLIIWSAITGNDRTQRRAARTKAIALTKAVAKLFLDDPTMGGRVNDARVLRCRRGWAKIQTVNYSIMNVPLLVNETGVSVD